jgi:hypothetical protein
VRELPALQRVAVEADRHKIFGVRAFWQVLPHPDELGEFTEGNAQEGRRSSKI